ncbi:MAG: hypothetical protein R3309_12860 [Reinekea sp.]|nr:hypothetical protein [Reinekea sp.]
MKTINLNQTVKVRLTKTGINIINKQKEELKNSTGGRYIPPKIRIDKDGYTHFQLWSLFDTFGNHIFLGCNPPFDLDIVFEDRK